MVGAFSIDLQTPSTVEGTEQCEMEILDASGKLVEKRKVALYGLEEWNCKECPSGLYLIRLLSDGIELAATKISVTR
jgi:hypothetical protein